MGKSFWLTLLLGVVLGVTAWNLLLAWIFKPWRPRPRPNLLEGTQDWGSVKAWGGGNGAGRGGKHGEG